MSAITAILTYFFTKLSVKSGFVVAFVAVNSAILVPYIAMLAFFTYGLLFVYNQINAFLVYFLGVINSQTFSLITQVLQSIGFFQALHDVFAIFSPFLIALLVFKVNSILLGIAKSIKTSIFELGVLSQQ